MTTISPQLDLITMERSSIDLYANGIGVPLVDIKRFANFMGYKDEVLQFIEERDGF